MDPRLESVFETLSRQDMPPILVGGAVRDLLLGRPVNDYDFVVGVPPGRLIEALPQLASAADCTVIPLDRERGVIRYCFSADFTVDVAVWQGDSLEQDLEKRDFTINAVAMDGEENLIDPTGGQGDLEARVIRMVSDSALKDDPLRVLRGLRLAAVLGFDVEHKTRAAILHHAEGLKRVAGERIASELFKFLAFADRGLMELFRQTRILTHLWGEEVADSTWDSFANWLAGTQVGLGRVLVRDRRSDRELSMLGYLLPDSISLDRLAERLKLSAAEVKFLSQWRWARAQLSTLESLTASELYDLCLGAGDALEGTLSFWEGSEQVKERIRRAAGGDGELCWDPLPLSGGELCQELGRQPGRWVGELMAKLERAWACRECKSVEELWQMARGDI